MFVIWKTKRCKDVDSPQTDRVNAVPFKVLPALFVFVEIDKNIPKCMWKDKGISFKNNFENTTNVGTQSMEIQNLLVVIIRKTVWYLQDRHIEQSRTKNPGIVPTNKPNCILKKALKQLRGRKLGFVLPTAF